MGKTGFYNLNIATGVVEEEKTLNSINSITGFVSHPAYDGGVGKMHRTGLVHSPYIVYSTYCYYVVTHPILSRFIAALWQQSRNIEINISKYKLVYVICRENHKMNNKYNMCINSAYIYVSVYVDVCTYTRIKTQTHV